MFFKKCTLLPVRNTSICVNNFFFFTEAYNHLSTHTKAPILIFQGTLYEIQELSSFLDAADGRIYPTTTSNF